MSALKFIAISGTTGVTENLYLYEYENDMIMVDCGVGFPEPEMYGVDLVIPDFTYVKQNIKKLRGILISHAHEDHLGALPFLFKDLKIKVPIYSTKLVAGFIKDKFSDYKNLNPKISVFDPERDTLTLGNFRVTPFRVSHSVPDGVGFSIDTPEGKIFHVPDYKFDWTPVDNRPFDVAKLSALASEGTLALVSDSLGATTPGYTESEKEIEGRIETIFRKYKGQIFFTTISSNISRMQQALNVAQRLGRKVSFVGRSIDRKAAIAKELGYLHYPDNLFIPLRRARKDPSQKMVYIISGSYGQPGSALYRLVLGEHEQLKIKREDVVVFSSDPAPPGSKTNVDFLVDKLIEADIDVHYYDLQEDLHVSGHGSIKDIEMLFALTNPKYLIPIGGTIRHMRAYGTIAQSMGFPIKNVLELNPGAVVEFSSGNARLAKKIPVKNILVDGLGIGDVGSVVLRDRQILARDGIVIIMVQLDRNEGTLISDPEVISRGFVYEGKNKRFLDQAGETLGKHLGDRGRLNAKLIRDETTDFLEKLFYEKIGRRPMVLPVVIEV
jgi:ribonuclease J